MRNDFNGSKNSRLVYSTDQGRIKPEKDKKDAVPGAEGPVRVLLEKKGRGGKVVTVVTGLAMSNQDLKALVKVFKKQSGSGGSVKQGAIELQGDHVAMVMEKLAASGQQVKRAGG